MADIPHLTQEEKDKVLFSDTLTHREKDYLQYIWYRGARNSGFQHALYNLAAVCDNENFEKLRSAFPDHLHPMLDWHNGTLAAKVVLALKKGN